MEKKISLDEKKRFCLISNCGKVQSYKIDQFEFVKSITVEPHANELYTASIYECKICGYIEESRGGSGY